VQLNTAAAAQAVPKANIDTMSALADLVSIRSFVRGFCRDALPTPMEEVRIAELELAVNEAASNIMRHAYDGHQNRPIRVEAEAHPDRIVVRLYDSGRSFDPDAAVPPSFDGTREGGFGVYMIAQSVDQVNHSRDSHGWNELTLVKYLHSPAAESAGLARS